MYLVFIIFLYEITQMFLKSAPKKNYMLRENHIYKDFIISNNEYFELVITDTIYG